MVKNSPANAGDTDLNPGSRPSLEEEMAAQCNSLAKETSWTEEPDWLRSLGLQKMDHDLAAEQQKQTHH